MCTAEVIPQVISPHVTNRSLSHTLQKHFLSTKWIAQKNNLASILIKGNEGVWENSLKPSMANLGILGFVSWRDTVKLLLNNSNT